MKRQNTSILQTLLKQSADIFPQGLLLDGSEIDDDEITPPFPAEYRYIINAVPKRQREFICARQVSRRLLLCCGYAPTSISVGESGCPIWPTGIAGSITHTDDYCLVALGKQNSITSIGIDLEKADAVEPGLWSQLFTAKEIETLNEEKESGTRNQLATIFFVSKEAFYKCHYFINRQWLDFKDISIEFNQRTKKILFFDSDGTAFTSYQGFALVVANHAVCIVWVEPPKNN